VHHYPHISALLDSAKHCSLCDVIRKYWSLGYIYSRFPDLEDDDSVTLPLSFELKHPGVFDSGVSWAILSGSINSK
jgi:hypothetical protein